MPNEGTTHRADGKRFNLALERAIAERSKGADKWEALVAIGAKLIDCAMNGEGWAIRELADRLDGKSIQPVDMKGNLNATVTYTVTGLGKR